MSHEHRGQCHYCGELNAYTELACSRCDTRLPWADAILQSRQVQQAAITPPVSQWMQPQMASPQSPLQMPLAQPLAAAQPRYCAHCGGPQTAGGAFCAHCGTPLHALLPTPLQAPLAESGKQKRTWGLPFRSASAPVAVTPVAATPTVNTPVYMMPQQMAHMMPQQPAINVSVVTTQNTSHSSGWWGRFTLFLFKVSMVFAVLFGVWLALVVSHR